MDKKLYELSNPQTSIWDTEQFYYGTNINNICGTAIISNVLNFNILKKAIENVIQKNDSFKIRFIKKNNVLKQYIDSSISTEIELVSLKNKEEISNLEQKLLCQVFKITEEPIFKFVIFKLQDNTGGFMLNIHHLLADSWTLGLTCKKIVQEYSSLISNTDKTSETDYSYIKYLENEQEYMQSNRYQKDKLYWEKTFETIPNIATLPSRNSTNTEFSCDGNRDLFTIPTKLVKEINQFCKKYNVSVFNFFMGILAIYINKLTNTDDFVIGTPILNRANSTEKNTTGMFVNITPLRITVEKNKYFSDFLQTIAKNSLALLRHQKYPYKEILDFVRKQDSSIPNLYNIILSYQITKANLEGNLKYETRWAFNGNSADNLDVQIYDLNETGSLNIAYDYKKSKYSTEEIKCLHSRILSLIKQVLSEENIEITKLKILTKNEEKEILKFNKTAMLYNKNIPVIKHFEKQVSSTPNNIALTFKGTQLTYKELNEKANSLAHHLRKAGVINNTIVGIMVNRSVEMIVRNFSNFKGWRRIFANRS